MPDWTRIAYWVVAGALVFAGFYLTFYGERSPFMLLAGIAMAIVGWFALGSGKAWTFVFGSLAAVAVAFLLDATVGL